MRYLALLSLIALVGCQPTPQVEEEQPPVTEVSLDALGDEFQMAPPSFVQEQEERMLGKYLWKKCLPPYENGEKPVLPASVKPVLPASVQLQ